MVRRKYDQDDVDKFIITAGLMSGVCAFFAPVVIVQLIQELMHFSYDNWLFVTPETAYRTVTAVMLAIPALVVCYFVTRHILIKKNIAFRAGWIFIMLTVFLIPVAGAGVNHYYYINEDGLYYNGLMDMNETVFLWEEMDQIQPVSVSENSNLIFYYIFTSSSGEQITIEGDDEFYRHRQAVFDKITVYGGEVLDRKEIQN